MSRRVRALLGLCACAGLLLGCRTAIPPAIPLPADDPRPRAMLAAWEAHAAARRGLRGVAKLAVDGGTDGVRLRGKQVLVVERPARLRVEILGFLNQTAAVLVTDGDTFEFFDAEERRFERGEVHPGLLWEVAHLALTPEEAVGLLLGAPLPEEELVVASARTAGEGGLRVALADATGAVRREVAFDAEGRLREVAALRGDGVVEWRAGFDDYELLDGMPFAHEISLDVLAGHTLATLSLRDVELNPELPDGLFRLRAPRRR